ncbi:hypothetical protein [Variovorax sp. OV329]|uniref:hypothetical protein n=1 Tax=Variovorax sp. OV329 TaxID=1882825 RepID=UPI001113EDAF|nr:hypothetical protein [Variovorax sp. OV329]
MLADYSSSMLRQIVFLLILLSALCRPYALAGQMPSDAWRAETTSHLALHAQKKAHHHHEDGSISVDESGESVKHVAMDGATGAVADFSLNPLRYFVSLSSAPRDAEQRPAPEPLLPRLRRPPKSAA